MAKSQFCTGFIVFIVSPLWEWRCGPSRRKCKQFSSWSGNQWRLEHVGLQRTCYQAGLTLQKVWYSCISTSYLCVPSTINAIDFVLLLILPVLFPNPSCPQSFLPQPNTPPDTESAKLCSPPAATWTSGIRDRDGRCCGWSVQSLVRPTPSWPLESWPQVYTRPSVEK